ncbi:MAG: DUF1330 domain-containing protein [Roseomonas sp.]|nr:DUF1330 domain-containing protein [Roseomonas sp.]
MPGYLIANIKVTDPEGFERYRAGVPAVIAQFGGRYLVRGGTMERVENAEGFNRVIVLEFPSLAAARAFYDSPEYAPLLKLRLDSTESQAILIEGYAG